MFAFADLLIEKEPLVNTYISVPRDKNSLNCASFTAGIIEAVLKVNFFFTLVFLFLFSPLFRSLILSTSFVKRSI